MDELASNLLATLKKPSASLDAKLNLFNSLKSNIKHQRIPESAQAPTVECIRLAITSQTSSTLVATGFATLPHLIKRLTLQDQVNVIFSPRADVIGALIDRLGDAKENYRAAASSCLGELWPTRPGDVMRVIKEKAIQSNNVRAKEAGMQWVVKTHAERSLQFKTFVPPLVECLDHADGIVRETAKNSLIDLFRNAPERAKADLKRQLIAKGVRKSIASHILSQLDISVPSELVSSTPAPSQPPARPVTPYHEPSTDSEPVLPPSQDTSNIEPLYVSSQRELEDAFRTMQPHFEGRESEGNWMPRDNSVLKLRRYLKGNAPEDYHVMFISSIRQMLDGILKVVNSLRTTMSSNGCNFVQELARTLGPSLDPMVEMLMQNMMKMCSATKHIAAQNGSATIDVILSSVSYNVRHLQHIWFAVQDKNVQPRTFAAGWLKTVMKRQANNKSHFEHTGGLEMVEKCIKKGLSDANPKVRETMRAAYWDFAPIWPDRGELIMNGLDAKSRQLLEKDSNNPNATQASFTRSVGPGSSANPRAATSNARTALKDTIAAQKKAALAAKRMPDRPNSAMAELSPVKEAGRPPAKSAVLAGSSATRGHPSTSSTTSSTRPGPTSSASSTAHGSLMSGPVRRPKRPDIPRPATADPYANRRLLRGESPPSRGSEQSPGRSESKGSVASVTSTTRKQAPQTGRRPGTSGTDTSSRGASPQVSPAKQRPRTIHGTDAVTAATPRSRPVGKMTSPSSAEDRTSAPTQRGRATPRPVKPEDELPSSAQSDLVNTADEDNFTFVMPPAMSSQLRPYAQSEIEEATSKQQQSPAKLQPSPLPNSSPQKQMRSSQDIGRAREEINSSVAVHEDASAADAAAFTQNDPPKVLQELPLNEQSPPPTRQPNDDSAEVGPEDIRSVSPPKKGIAFTTDGTNQERAEVLKNRRILSSGIERLRARTLDAHGFRRLQDITKVPAHDSNVQMADLQTALIDYIESPLETLKVSANKAVSLKSQALGAMRSLAMLHRSAEEVREGFPHALCAILVARQMMDAAPHHAADLERTAYEIIKNAGDRVADCLDQVLDFVSRERASGAEQQRRMVPMALGVLGKIQIMLRSQSMGLSKVQSQQLGKLIVRFLEDPDPDVRRADTELSLELFGHFGEERKDEFWTLLKGAREAQLNLVAYYLARRMQGAR